MIDILSSPTIVAAAIPEELRHQIYVFYKLYKGFPQFVAIVIAGSALPLLLLVWLRYALARRRSNPNNGPNKGPNKGPNTGLDTGSFTAFAGQTLRDWRWQLCFLLVLDAFLITTHAVARGMAVGMWDCDSQFLPYQILVADFARAWRLIGWDPWSECGLPMAGDPQVGANSPLNVIVGFITGGATGGFRFYWLLAWGLGGAGIVMLAKQIKAPTWGAAVVALGFTFSGIYTGHAEHTSWITAFSAMPWILWRIEAAASSGKLQPGLEAGAIWGLSALGGYPAQAMITGCFAALWAVGRWLFRESPESSGDEFTAPQRRGDSVDISERGSKRFPGSSLRTLSNLCASAVKEAPRLIIILTLFSVIGLIVLAPTYFSFFYEGKGVHNRIGTLERERAVSEGAFAPGALTTFASPFLPMLKMAYLVEGDPIWRGLDVSMCSIYAGALIPVLALLALLIRPRDRWRWWLLFLGLFNLSCAMSDTFPTRGWLYDWFYPTRFFRHPSLFRAYFILAMTALALFATRDLARALAKPDERIRKRLVLASTLAAATALLTLLWFNGYLQSLPPHNISSTWKSVAALHALMVWLGAVLVAILFWRFPVRVRSWRLPALFIALAFTDAFLTCVISLNTIAITSNVERWRRLDVQHSASLDLTGNGLQRYETTSYTDPTSYLSNNDQMINKIPVFASNTTTSNNFHKGIWEDNVLKRMALGSERIWFVREAAQLPLSDSLFFEFKKLGRLVNGFPVVIHAQQEMLQQASGAQQSSPQELLAQIEKLPLAENIPVKLLKYEPEELTFEVHCPDEGWLMVTDRWSRSWRAEINGNATDVYGGNFIFRAVRVPAGLNRIKFSYHPLGRSWLIVMSWGTLALIALAAAYGKLRKI